MVLFTTLADIEVEETANNGKGPTTRQQIEAWVSISPSACMWWRHSLRIESRHSTIRVYFESGSYNANQIVYVKTSRPEGKVSAHT